MYVPVMESREIIELGLRVHELDLYLIELKPMGVLDQYSACAVLGTADGRATTKLYLKDGKWVEA